MGYPEAKEGERPAGAEIEQPELEYIEGITFLIQKEHKNCVHNDRSYAPYILTSNPPQYDWICRECGFKGTERGLPIFNDYDRIVRKFQS